MSGLVPSTGLHPVLLVTPLSQAVDIPGFQGFQNPLEAAFARHAEQGPAHALIGHDGRGEKAPQHWEHRPEDNIDPDAVDASSGNFAMHRNGQPRPEHECAEVQAQQVVFGLALEPGSNDPTSFGVGGSGARDVDECRAGVNLDLGGAGRQGDRMVDGCVACLAESGGAVPQTEETRAEARQLRFLGFGA